MEYGLAWSGALLVAAAIATLALVTVSFPLLRAHALVRPNSRSSHVTPTPQGGGAAVLISALGVGWCALIASGIDGAQATGLVGLTVAAVLLAVAGAIDDVRGLSPTFRLFVQSIAVAMVLAWNPDQPIFPFLPAWFERCLLLLGGVWLVNLVNFMDGIDWMTVVEVVPITGAVILIGWIGTLPPSVPLIAAALLGAMLGFAPFNKPVARLFLGDVGSLPIGLLLGWLLLMLAAHGQLAAAILLPLYYIADATLTLGMRLWRGERVSQAHRSHFYQRAAAGALSVSGVVARVFVTNLGLAALALTCVRADNSLVSGASLALGAALVALLLVRFARAAKPAA